jgi:hypothetical protein
MDEETKGIIAVMVCIVVLFIGSILALGSATRGTPMQQCIKQGYEWIDNNCVDRD